MTRTRIGDGTGRPARNFTTGATTVWLRRLSVAVAGAITVLVLVRYPGLPDTIPVHFGPGGEADAWGSKTTVLFLALIMLVCIGGADWASRHPDSIWMNYPKDVTEDNAQRLYRAGGQSLVWLNAGLVAIYGGMATTMLSEINATVVLVPGLIVLIGATVAGLTKTIRA
ncbi:DUF1648 domain-containing protein [Corynebacterium glyciniphilum]|uniref:DUF1648 domain-containing protein n=2 Tax=Corynebacterium glyciniphilum TaxID=1404244 RepID=UPI0026EE0602|nr:DUF1648 domain-containing protein [Corynebacterium glyciniphilum]